MPNTMRPMPDLPQGTVTFVFTDIEESTELLKRLGDRYAEVLSLHRRLVREAFTGSGGIEMDTQGDAFFFVFSRARDAVSAAVEAQRAHAAAAWPNDETVRVRIGLHTGEPALHEEGYVGLDVVRAARICTVGRGGQILLSETTRALLGSGLPDGVTVFPLGQRHLRGIDEPERVYEIAIEDLERGEAEAEPPAPPEPSAPPAPVAPAGLEKRVEGRFDDLGSRLAAGIQEQVLRRLEDKLGRLEPPADGSGESDSGVDDIAVRMQALGDEIDARIQAALAKRKLPPDA
jgi:class 3 adenylate cyclase